MYYNKLQSGSIKTAIVSTNDDKIDKDIQTDDLGLSDKHNQAPDDFYINYNLETKDTYVRKKKRKNEAL